MAVEKVVKLDEILALQLVVLTDLILADCLVKGMAALMAVMLDLTQVDSLASPQVVL